MNYGSAFCPRAGVSTVETLLKEQSKTVFSRADVKMWVVASGGFSWMSVTCSLFDGRELLVPQIKS